MVDCGFWKRPQKQQSNGYPVFPLCRCSEVEPMEKRIDTNVQGGSVTQYQYTVLFEPQMDLCAVIVLAIPVLTPK
jgi:hypothetical protein